MVLHGGGDPRTDLDRSALRRDNNNRSLERQRTATDRRRRMTLMTISLTLDSYASRSPWTDALGIAWDMFVSPIITLLDCLDFELKVVDVAEQRRIGW